MTKAGGLLRGSLMSFLEVIRSSHHGHQQERDARGAPQLT